MKHQSADRLTGCYGYRLILDTGNYLQTGLAYRYWIQVTIYKLGWLTDCMETTL